MNDRNFLKLYKMEKNLETLLALCFTQTDERFHHWNVFASGSACVCIRFDRATFIASVDKHESIRKRTVRYLTLPEIRQETPKIRDLLFLKRAAFQDEKEFRLIYESRRSQTGRSYHPDSVVLHHAHHFKPLAERGIVRLPEGVAALHKGMRQAERR